jgi:glycosyltransferase involved in cell wall biosynthesis
MKYPKDEKSYERIFERRLVRELKDLCDIEILSWNEDKDADAYYLDGVRVNLIYIMPYEKIQMRYDTHRGIAGELLNIINDLKKFVGTWRGLRELHKRKKLDVIFHASFSMSAIYALLFAKIHRIPICTQCTGYDVDVIPEIDYGVRLKRGRMKLFSEISCRYVNLLLPNSKGIADDTFLKNLKNVKVLLQGVNIEEFKRSSKTKRKDRPEIMVLNVGGLQKVKGWNYIVETAKILKDQKIKFLIIGSNADLKEYNKLISDYNLKNIKFIGKVTPKEAKKYYGMADIFFFPSLSEGLPNALLEASAMELPLIGSGRGGTKDIIINNQNGYYTEGCDPKFFAEKIIHLAKHPSLRKKMGRNARKYVIEKFQWKMTAENLIKICNKLLSPK